MNDMVKISPMVEVREQLDKMVAQFQMALPAHIPVERFSRVVMTAIQNNPKLILCTRQSLWNSCMKAAQDGLLPDGREGAIVPNGDIAGWRPMIAGIRKKVRNSGEIATWDVHIVHQKDKFAFRLGDDPFIAHEPSLEDDPGPSIAAYSIAVLKSGEKSRDVMSMGAIRRIRDRSDAWRAFQAQKIKSTPWSTDEDEMAKKTVARRHSKVLPMSTDIDDLLRRDDDLYDMEGAKDEAQQDRPKSLAGKLDALANMPFDEDREEKPPAEQATTAEQTTATTTDQASPQDKPKVAASGPVATGEGAPVDDKSPKAGQAGAPEPDKKDPPKQDKKKPTEPTEGAAPAAPKNNDDYFAYASTWIAAADDAAAAQARWKDEKQLRRKCNITNETFNDLEAALKDKVAAIGGGK